MHMLTPLTTWVSFSALFGMKPVIAVTFTDVEHTFDTLQIWYNSSLGLWSPSTGWWNSANCLTTIVNLAGMDEKIKERTKDLWNEVHINAAISNTHSTAKLDARWSRRVSPYDLQSLQPEVAAKFSKRDQVGFLNDFYDDEGWWSLAWIPVFDHTQDERYLNEAVTIFNDMHAAWNTTPVGGLWWDKGKQYVNAIPNELYLSIAAHLANRRHQDTQYYADLARTAWDWIFASGMINNQGNIEDGLEVGSHPGNPIMVWSYNQGVILSALTELAQATSQPGYVQIAKLIADAALANLTSTNGGYHSDSILRDPCEYGVPIQCGSDSSHFKGIFARNLAHLQSVSPEDRYADFLQRNAESLWQSGRDQYNRLGLLWGGPLIERANASTHCSGMDLLLGALAQVGEWNDGGNEAPADVSRREYESPVGTDLDGAATRVPAKAPPSVRGAHVPQRDFFGLW